MQNSYYRLEITPRSNFPDPGVATITQQADQFLGLKLEGLATRDVYSLFINCSDAEAGDIKTAFTNPVIEVGHLGETSPGIEFDWFIMVGFRPGVTDNVARSAQSAISDILGRSLSKAENVYSAREYFVCGKKLTRPDIYHLADDLIANELIHSVNVMSYNEWYAQGAPINRPVVKSEEEPSVEEVNLEVDDDELMRINRERVLALTLPEMRIVREYYRRTKEDRENAGLHAQPTDVELECIAQTWSEHCKHKIFNADVEYEDENGEITNINSCFKSFIMRSTEELGEELDWLVSVFHDNAGIIRFNDEVDLVFKVETHNSPAALDPYGGAMTGIVGVNRDPLGTGMGADLKLNVWGYCFASPFTAENEVPQGLFHPRRLRDQVHKGVIDGGNQSGIPYASGWEYFDRRYLGKPLVYCGTVGTIPRNILGQPAHEKHIECGDYVLMIGGRIGKDGIHGATFSSEELHMESPTQAVQIGDPITQKRMTDFLMEARDQRLYRFITDNGAGGLSSSVGEMAEESNGCDIDLAKAPLKYAGLQPWEILISEAQERMSLAVQPECLDAFLELAERRDVEATVLGNFTDDGKFTVRYNEEIVAYLDIQFMHHGLPPLSLRAKWQPPQYKEPSISDNELDIGQELLTMLGRLNICSGEYKARQYDHEVKGLSVLKPYVGVENNVQNDATISTVKPLEKEGVILSSGFAPRYSDIDTYHMMASVIDMAIRRVIAVGGRLGHIAGLDNFCWPDPVATEKNPDGEYKMAQLVRANMALYDYTKAFKVPCISGKDSMKNDSTMGGEKISIPPSVLFSVISRMDDITQAVTLGVKNAGDIVYVLGKTKAELGGSEFYADKGWIGNSVPTVNSQEALTLYRKVAEAVDAGLFKSLHTPAFGGLGVSFCKKAIAGGFGLDIDLTEIPAEKDLRLFELLFSESNSRFICTVSPENTERFENIMSDVSFAETGMVIKDPEIRFRKGDSDVAVIGLNTAKEKYTKTLDRL